MSSNAESNRLNTYSIDLNYLTIDDAPCEGIRAVVAYLESIGTKGIGVGRATVTIEQVDLRKLREEAQVVIERGGAPWGNSLNPLLIRFYDDPDVWVVPKEELDEDAHGIFVSEEEIPDAEFIESHQQAFLIHGGRYGVYEVYKIHNPDDPIENWKWEKLSHLSPEEIRKRVMDDLRRAEGFNGTHRQAISSGEQRSAYRHVADTELERIAREMQLLCEQYLTRLSELEQGNIF